MPASTLPTSALGEDAAAQAREDRDQRRAEGQAGGAGQHRTDGEADRRAPVQGQPDHNEEHHADRTNGGVLPVEVGPCTLLDRRGDLLHALVAR